MFSAYAMPAISSTDPMITAITMPAIDPDARPVEACAVLVSVKEFYQRE